MMYEIVFSHWEQHGEEIPSPPGYNAYDYCPQFNEVRCDPDSVERWLRANHLGPDSDGITAVFVVQVADGGPDE
jgi:hypothetical protein